VSAGPGPTTIEEGIEGQPRQTKEQGQADADDHHQKYSEKK